MKHKNFFIVPNQIFDLGLKPKELTVYCCLLMHRNKNTDNCFPLHRLIAYECCIDMKTIDSALKELESRGLIKKLCRYRENGSRTSNLYTHEAIIDQTTWELAQAVRKGKRRRTAMGGIDEYSGLLYCADCNSKLYFIRGTTLKTDAYGFICSRYRKHMGEAECTPHSIRAKVLDEIILEEIRKVT